MQTYIHACMHAYICAHRHMYIPTDIHSNIHAWIHGYNGYIPDPWIHRDHQKNIHADINTDIHSYMHTSIHSCMHACHAIHPYIHAFIHPSSSIHPYRHTYIQTCVNTVLYARHLQLVCMHVRCARTTADICRCTGTMDRHPANLHLILDMIASKHRLQVVQAWFVQYNISMCVFTLRG